jgi:hypothetical protein
MAAFGQKWRVGQSPLHSKPGVDYPIKVHISEIHLRNPYVGMRQTDELVYADATLDGKKVELCGVLEPIPGHHTAPPRPADYKARLLREPRKHGAYNATDPEIDRIYELVMPDGTLWTASVTGISE